jgi:hypothetical protein
LSGRCPAGSARRATLNGNLFDSELVSVDETPARPPTPPLLSARRPPASLPARPPAHGYPHMPVHGCLRANTNGRHVLTAVAAPFLAAMAARSVASISSDSSSTSLRSMSRRADSMALFFSICARPSAQAWCESAARPHRKLAALLGGQVRLPRDGRLPFLHRHARGNSTRGAVQTHAAAMACTVPARAAPMGKGAAVERSSTRIKLGSWSEMNSVSDGVTTSSERPPLIWSHASADYRCKPGVARFA